MLEYDAQYPRCGIGGPADRSTRRLGLAPTNRTARTALASAGAAAPGSQQDFVVNVGDRVFFESDSTELSAHRATRWRSRRSWLQQYRSYAFTIEGHADERGTREYNIALGARRAQAVRDYLTARGIEGHAHAHHLLRQGAAGRGV